MSAGCRSASPGWPMRRSWEAPFWPRSGWAFIRTWKAPSRTWCMWSAAWSPMRAGTRRTVRSTRPTRTATGRSLRSCTARRRAHELASNLHPGCTTCSSLGSDISEQCAWVTSSDATGRCRRAHSHGTLYRRAAARRSVGRLDPTPASWARQARRLAEDARERAQLGRADRSVSVHVEDGVVARVAEPAAEAPLETEEIGSTDDAVVVEVRIARASVAVAVDVALVGVRVQRAVVGDVRESVAVAVRLGGLRNPVARPSAGTVEKGLEERLAPWLRQVDARGAVAHAGHDAQPVAGCNGASEDVLDVGEIGRASIQTSIALEHRGAGHRELGGPRVELPEQVFDHAAAVAVWDRRGPHRSHVAVQVLQAVAIVVVARTGRDRRRGGDGERIRNAGDAPLGIEVQIRGRVRDHVAEGAVRVPVRGGAPRREAIHELAAGRVTGDDDRPEVRERARRGHPIDDRVDDGKGRDAGRSRVRDGAPRAVSLPPAAVPEGQRGRQGPGDDVLLLEELRSDHQGLLGLARDLRRRHHVREVGVAVATQAVDHDHHAHDRRARNVEGMAPLVGDLETDAGDLDREAPRAHVADGNSARRRRPCQDRERDEDDAAQAPRGCVEDPRRPARRPSITLAPHPELPPRHSTYTSPGSRSSAVITVTRRLEILDAGRDPPGAASGPSACASALPRRDEPARLDPRRGRRRGAPSRGAQARGVGLHRRRSASHAITSDAMSRRLSPVTCSSVTSDAGPKDPDRGPPAPHRQHIFTDRRNFRHEANGSARGARVAVRSWIRDAALIVYWGGWSSHAQSRTLPQRP